MFEVSKIDTPCAIAMEQLDKVHRKIRMQERLWGRAPGSVSLVIVTKGIGVELIAHMIANGQNIFAENQVTEAERKWMTLKKQAWSPELRLIGPLQSNKVRKAITLFDVIETISSDELAENVARELTFHAHKKLRLYVQINTGLESQKNGIDPRDTIPFINRCRFVHGLDISGLMCIPPVNKNPGPHFALLNKLAKETNTQDISMGMSADFETAISTGATHIRIGRAIFDLTAEGAKTS